MTFLVLDNIETIYSPLRVSTLEERGEGGERKGKKGICREGRKRWKQRRKKSSRERGTWKRGSEESLREKGIGRKGREKEGRTQRVEEEGKIRGEGKRIWH